jgi:16S rRNA (cytosine967-C5)-methyltransferase
MAVEHGRAHCDDLLRARAVDALSPADCNLATMLVLGVLRWQVQMDARLKNLLKKPGAKLDPEVLTALRLGAFQLLFLDRIPAHAAIGESVELARQSGHRFASGMVNAVLRRLGKAPPFSFPSETPAGLALVLAHPAWMVERWSVFYGLEAARAICLHGQTQPPLTVRIEGPAVAAELEQAGVRLEPGSLLAAARTVVSGAVVATAAFREGHIRVQDEGSQLIGELAASAIEDPNQKALRILDACAAPGGKTLILAERHREAHIAACEANPRRFAELCKRLVAHAGRVECLLVDAAALQKESTFDFALVDAPCSGTGTLGRNPEIRHRLRPADLKRQADRQRAILTTSLRAVRRGGHVAYSTCSLEPEENEQVVTTVLAENRDCRQVSLAHSIELLSRDGILTPSGAEQLQKCLTREGALRLLPGAVPTDGFFVALIEKAV